MLGLAKQISYKDLHRLVSLGVAGYLINVATGIMFLTTSLDPSVHSPAFQTRTLVMLLAGINLLVFYGFFNRQVSNAALPLFQHAQN